MLGLHPGARRAARHTPKHSQAGCKAASQVARAVAPQSGTSAATHRSRAYSRTKKQGAAAAGCKGQGRGGCITLRVGRSGGGGGSGGMAQRGGSGERSKAYFGSCCQLLWPQRRPPGARRLAASTPRAGRRPSPTLSETAESQNSIAARQATAPWQEAESARARRALAGRMARRKTVRKSVCNVNLTSAPLHSCGMQAAAALRQVGACRTPAHAAAHVCRSRKALVPTPLASECTVQRWLESTAHWQPALHALAVRSVPQPNSTPLGPAPCARRLHGTMHIEDCTGATTVKRSVLN